MEQRNTPRGPVAHEDPRLGSARSQLGRRPGPATLAGGGLALIGLVGCGSSSSAVDGEVDTGGVGESATLSIVACSLGCTPDASGGTISCAISEIHVNQVIAVEFDKPVDPASLGPLSFRVVSENGSTPSGEYLVDPSNPRRVLFRPQVTFGSDGLPQFGFSPTLSYTIEVPAASPGALGFFVSGLGGQKNVTPLLCTVTPSLAVQDVVVGPPLVTPTIEELVPGGAVYDAFTDPVGVASDARLRFEFDDVMNPATLANVVTLQSDFIEVRLDLDGDVTDASDQIDVPGEFVVEISQTTQEQSTRVVFTPDAGFPTSGSDPTQPRRIVVTLPPTIADLGGNPLANPGTFSFTTVGNPALEEELVATFDGSAADLDRGRTSLLPDEAFVAAAGTGDGPELGGRLLRGLGGGSGRLGDLVVPGGTELILSTDPGVPTRFGPDLVDGPVIDDQGTPEPEDDLIAAYHVRAEIVDAGSYPLDWATNGVDGDGPGESVATIADGTFEFASLAVAPGGRIRLVGDRPGRIFVRGDADIRGVILAEGQSAADQASLAGFGGAGGAAGPGGGAGGAGGDRGVVLGQPLKATDGFAHLPDAVLDLDGAAGEGRGGQAIAGGEDFGAGPGGASFPAVYPGPSLEQLGGFEPNQSCESSQVGVPGGGGSYALPGAVATWSSPKPLQGIPVPPVLPAASTSLLSADLVDLDPDAGGVLVGGAGGGGGGNGIAGARINASSFTSCVPAVGAPFITIFYDASGAGGGGGGGGLQLQVGHRLSIDGALTAAGGDGGGLAPGASSPQESTAAPGGGGSGGALLLQAFHVDLAPFPGVLDVSGGQGGSNQETQSRGGDGAPGVVRIENSGYLSGALPPGVEVGEALDPAAVAPTVAPALGDPPDAAVPAAKVLAVADWDQVQSGPGATVGLQTCWLLPAPGSFEAEFLADGADGELGWDLILELSGALGTIDGELVGLRGDPGSLAPLTAGASLAEVLGNALGVPGAPGSAVVVRFQGLRLLGDVDDPCAVDPDGAGSPVLPGSLTPWLGSPAELSSYWADALGAPGGLAAQRRPNAIRAQVLIAGADPLATALRSVVELRVRVVTD